MTPRGLEGFRAKIGLLEKKVKEIQSKVSEVTTQAAETFHDNAPYDTLVEELRLFNSLLGEAHDDLNNAKIQEYPRDPNPVRVSYGTRVQFLRDGEFFDFRIVGYGDSDPKQDRIVYDAPIAVTLRGHYEGDSFIANIRGEKTRIVIKKILPLDPELF